MLALLVLLRGGRGGSGVAVYSVCTAYSVQNTEHTKSVQFHGTVAGAMQRAASISRRYSSALFVMELQ